MNAKILYTKEHKGLGEWEFKETEWWICESCKTVHWAEERANECCDWRKEYNCSEINKV